MRGDEADNQEDFHRDKGDGSATMGGTSCVDLDQMASVYDADGKVETDSCTDTNKGNSEIWFKKKNIAKS